MTKISAFRGKWKEARSYVDESIGIIEKKYGSPEGISVGEK